MTPRPPRVIVLEDHAFQRSIAVSMLRQMGCEQVYEAADGAEALSILQKVGQVDIALCDLQMDGMDGLEFTQAVGASGLVKSIIICSAVSADIRRAVGLIASLSGLELLGNIGKPLKYAELERILKIYAATAKTEAPPAATIELPTDAEVRAAISAQQFVAYYQPKFNLKTGEVKGVEVLARWQHPSRGVLAPSYFLPAVERCGLMDELLFAMLLQSMKLWSMLFNAHLSVNFALNLHTSQLSNVHLVPMINALLDQSSMPGSALTFELTESGLLDAPATSMDCLVRLRMMGCSLSIDDFGAGFSSLQRLCKLPFNEIKLDAEFVRRLKHEPRCEAVIRSTLALGEALGLSVVVEGIETEEQRQHLIELGCVEGQGYLCARPMDDLSFLSWLKSQQVEKHE